jgi:hypothetical protein
MINKKEERDKKIDACQDQRCVWIGNVFEICLIHLFTFFAGSDFIFCLKVERG